MAAALGDPGLVRNGTATAGGACTQFLVPPEGELREVTGVEDAAGAEGVFAVRIYRTSGYRFGQFRTGADRGGAVQAVGTDREDAVSRAGAAAGLIRFELR